MTQFSVILAASLLVSAASAAGGNSCKAGNIVNMPQNGQPYYWPLSWRENTTAPHLATGQSCSWTVTIPAGYFAKVTIDGKVGDQISRFQTIDAAGNLVLFTHEKKLPYYFPDPKMTLAISTEASATFAFKIEWAKRPSLSEIHGIGGVPHLVNATDKLYNEEYGTSSGDHISMLTIPADRKNLHYLRSVLVYDGNNNNNNQGTYINNLAAIYEASRQQFVSPSPGLIMINLEASDSMDRYIIQDYKYTKDIAEYTEMYCGGNTTCTATVNGGKHKSALISTSHFNETLVDIQMDDKANLTIYYGSPFSFELDSTYSAAELKSKLPITFYGDLTQYVISTGKAVFTFNMTPE